MGIGLGIVLIVAGAVLLWAIEIDLQFIDDATLGWILIVAGILSLVLVLALNAQQRRTTHVEERRYENR